MLARLALLYPDTFHAYAWMGLAFMAPYTTEFDLDATMAQIKAAFGYEGCAYWQFFLRDDAHRVIQQHVSLRLRLCWPYVALGLTCALGRQLLATSVSERSRRMAHSHRAAGEDGGMRRGRSAAWPPVLRRRPGPQSSTIRSCLRYLRTRILQMYAALRDNILTNGVQSSLKWYNAQAEGVDLEDNRSKYTPQPGCWSQGGDYSYSSLVYQNSPKTT